MSVQIMKPMVPATEVLFIRGIPRGLRNRFKAQSDAKPVPGAKGEKSDPVVLYIRGVPNQLKASFKAHCAKRDVTMQVKAIQFMKDCLSGPPLVKKTPMKNRFAAFMRECCKKDAVS